MSSWTGRGAATRIYLPEFDADFQTLPGKIQSLIEQKLHDMGTRLHDFPHHRLTGSMDCRLRVGDYRVLYQFDPAKNEIYVLAVGHRREIYR
jgi:mRNA interferase RelE/StbE